MESKVVGCTRGKGKGDCAAQKRARIWNKQGRVLKKCHGKAHCEVVLGNPAMNVYGTGKIHIDVTAKSVLPKTLLQGLVIREQNTSVNE